MTVTTNVTGLYSNGADASAGDSTSPATSIASSASSATPVSTGWLSSFLSGVRSFFVSGTPNRTPVVPSTGSSLGAVAGSSASPGITRYAGGEAASPAASSASALPALTSYYEQEAYRDSYLRSAVSGIDLQIVPDNPQLSMDVVVRKPGETDRKFLIRSIGEFKAYASKAASALNGPEFANVRNTATGSIYSLDQRIEQAKKFLDVGGQANIDKGLETMADAARDLDIVSKALVPGVSAGAVELEQNLGITVGDLSAGRNARKLAGTFASPEKDFHNVSVSRLDADTSAALDRLKEIKSITDPGARDKAMLRLASEFRAINERRHSLSDQFVLLKDKQHTEGLFRFNGMGEKLGVDWTAVTGIMSLLSPIALAGLSYYQAEKNAKRSHEWAVEDREDEQAFTASENAATRASNEAMAAMESEDDSSGSVGASSAGSIGGSIASA